MILINHNYTFHFCVIIFTISAFIFTQNISIILNTINPPNETFYEFGGIMITISYHILKLKKLYNEKNKYKKYCDYSPR